MSRLCEQCDGRCCSHYVVPITSYDVKRILELGYDPSYFLDFLHIGTIQCDYHDIRLGHTYKYLILKRNQDGTCIFSEKTGNKLVCTIHGSHPLTCRVYPFSPSTGKMRAKYLCRKNADYGKQNKSLFEKEIAEAIKYNEIVRTWNTQDGQKDVEGFLSHILKD